MMDVIPFTNKHLSYDKGHHHQTNFSFLFFHHLFFPLTQAFANITFHSNELLT